MKAVLILAMVALMSGCMASIGTPPATVHEYSSVPATTMVAAPATAVTTTTY